MAKFLGKDQVTYSKERDGFLRDLQNFHESRGTPYRRPPTLGGKEIDLYLLYSLVTAQGGWIKVNSKNAWSDLLPCFKLPSNCVNGSVALKQIYLRYLDRWEKVHYLGEEGDRGSDDDEESRHKRWSARALHSVPYNYNYVQHNIADISRELNHLSADLYKPSDYDRLALSLISPLPNEQDFAINVCTLLSNDGKHTLKLEKHPRIINYLLGHAGVFHHTTLRKLFINFYNQVRKKPIHNFWDDVVESKEYLDLTDEVKFYQSLETSSIWNRSKFEIEDEDFLKKITATNVNKEDIDSGDAVTPMDVDANNSVNSEESSEDCEIVDDNKLKLNESDAELFCVKRTFGTQDYIGQRVIQIATILRNLSFIEENVPILVENKTFIRFLLLCATSQWNVLKNLGLDMLGNVATEFVINKDVPCDHLTTTLLKIVSRGLESEDRASCISSLEVLNKLSQNEKNEDALLKTLEAHVYKRVCAFLTIHDVMLLIYTLECLYSLSSLGERSCNLIVGNHGVVDTLVSLVTVEGKSYGPKACIGMKLVETLPSGMNAAASQTPQQLASTAAAASTNAAATASAASSAAATSTLATVSAVSTVATSTVTPAVATAVVSATTMSPIAPKNQATPVRSVQMNPQRLVTITPSSSATTGVATTTSSSSQTTISPQQLIQQQHAHQQTVHENEQFALAWLRATYEPATNSKIDHQELYKHYIGSCSKIGRKGVISPLHFPRCVRSVFGGTVGPNPVKSSSGGGSDQQFYEGIKVRPQPLIINIQQHSATATATNKQTAAAANATGANRSRKTAISNVQPIKSPPIVPQSTVSPNTAVATTATTTAAAAATSVMTAANTESNSSDNSSNVSNSNVSNNSGTAAAPTAVVTTANSPASPILKAQLSAPPKQRDIPPVASCNKGDVKSQVMAHPHLSQALLGTNSANVGAAGSSSAGAQLPTNTVVITNQGGQSTSSSLIKSLLANKVNDCMPAAAVSMRTETDCQNVAQVAARQQQQRLLAQQNSTPESKPSQSKTESTPKLSRINGARQLFNDSDIGDPSVSSTTHSPSSSAKGKKEPPQPPPPPLVPLSSGSVNNKSKTPRLDNEDSDSIGNHSLASSTGIGTIGIGGISSTEDGDNSLTSFEGLLNGIPNIDNPLNEDSSSKDSIRTNEITINKPLRLADLLEKKFEKNAPILNGALGGKEKAGDLLDNHIEKALSRDNDLNSNSATSTNNSIISEKGIKEDKPNLKRPATDDIVDSEPKKSCTSSNNINGADSPAPDSVSSSNGDEPTATVSTAAAKLFADIAADILEDEDEEQLLQEAQTPSQPQIAPEPVAVAPPTVNNAPLQQIIMDNSQQVLRQIIVSQAQMPTAAGQVVISAGTQLKTQTGQTVIVQNPNQQRTPVVLQQNTGQFLLSQNIQGQMQLVASGQPGQYVIQTSNSPGTYMVAQPQTAVVHGQTQTVLVAQTSQQQGTGAKTIIILQQQPNNAATHHQKVVVTPQGQQVVVTQVPRPVIHTSSVSNNVAGAAAKLIKAAPPNVTVNAQNGTVSLVATTSTATPTIVTANVKSEDEKTATAANTAAGVKTKPVRDLNTPFVCEWGDCNVPTKFKSANEVYLHVCAAHCPTGSEEIICQWERCDNMKRKRFSLMTHLHDKHCNTESMKQSLIRRKQVAAGGKVEPPPPAPTTPHPGYAPDAALHAIKRHALEFVNPKELQLKSGAKVQGGGVAIMSATNVVNGQSRPGGPPPPVEQDDNEGPVTKSIRLTASLILRNLVIYSGNCRRYLKHYEPHLANVALSNVESSRTIAQVLYDLNNGSTIR